MSENEAPSGVQLGFTDKRGEHIQLELVVGTYGATGALAVTAYRWAADMEGPWCDITKNLSDSPELPTGQVHLADLDDPLKSLMNQLGREVEVGIPTSYKLFQFDPETFELMRDWEQFRDAWRAEFEPDLDEEEPEVLPAVDQEAPPERRGDVREP